MMNKTITPEDMIPNGVDGIMINDIYVRKGSIGAFIANIKLLETDGISAQEQEAAYQQLINLAPALIALNIDHYCIFKNKMVNQILADARTQ